MMSECLGGEWLHIYILYMFSFIWLQTLNQRNKTCENISFVLYHFLKVVGRLISGGNNLTVFLHQTVLLVCNEHYGLSGLSIATTHTFSLVWKLLPFLRNSLAAVTFPFTLWWYKIGADEGGEKSEWLVSVLPSWIILTRFQNLVYSAGRNIHLEQPPRRLNYTVTYEWQPTISLCVCPHMALFVRTGLDFTMRTICPVLLPPKGCLRVRTWFWG